MYAEIIYMGLVYMGECAGFLLFYFQLIVKIVYSTLNDLNLSVFCTNNVLLKC